MAIDNSTPFWQRFLEYADAAFTFLVDDYGFQRILVDHPTSAKSPQTSYYVPFGKLDVAVAPATEISGPVSVHIFKQGSPTVYRLGRGATGCFIVGWQFCFSHPTLLDTDDDASCAGGDPIASRWGTLGFACFGLCMLNFNGLLGSIDSSENSGGPEETSSGRA